MSVVLFSFYRVRNEPQRTNVRGNFHAVEWGEMPGNQKIYLGRIDFFAEKSETT